MDKSTTMSESPVSFPVSVARLPQKGMPVVIEADEARRDALAAEHALLSVESFRADLLVERWKRDGVRVTGTVRARIVQACITTLDPVDALIDEDVEALYVPEWSKLARPRVDSQGEIMIDPEGPDLPETFSGDTIDVGALAEEFFALAIDPYPRGPRAGEAPLAVDTEAGAGPDSPFAKLRILKPES